MGLGVFAAPDVGAGLRLRLDGRAQRSHRRLVLPLLGDHQLVGGVGIGAAATAKQAVQEAVLAGRLRRRGLLGLGFIREIFILGLVGTLRGGIDVAAAQRDVDRLEMVGVVGGFQAERPAFFLAGVVETALFIWHDGDGIGEEALEIRFALVQRGGVGNIPLRGHLAQKVLDDAGAGGVLGAALGGGGLLHRPGRLHILHRLHGLGRTHWGRRGGSRLGIRDRLHRPLGGCRTGRFRCAAGCRCGHGGRCRSCPGTAHNFIKIVRAAEIGKSDLAVLGRRVLQRRGGNTHAAQNFIDLMIGDAGAYAVRRLALVQIRQDTVYRIIGTFAWHFYAPFIR